MVIHNRKEPDVNILRSYLTSTVGRCIKPERLEQIRTRNHERGAKPPTTGFLSLSSDALDIAGKTRGDGGEKSSTKSTHAAIPSPNTGRGRNSDPYAKWSLLSWSSRGSRTSNSRAGFFR